MTQDCRSELFKIVPIVFGATICSNKDFVPDMHCSKYNGNIDFGLVEHGELCMYRRRDFISCRTLLLCLFQLLHSGHQYQNGCKVF